MAVQSFYSLVLLLCSLLLLAVVRCDDPSSLFEFKVKDASGTDVSMDRYAEAKVVIVVNVASNCGYTYTNYRELQKLYEAYKPHGLEIVGFPCNQFGEQEPGTDDEIQMFVNNYGITWPVMAKVDVNGPGSHDMFRFLKDKTGQTEIGWNFAKFLIVDGKPVKRYASNVSPNKMAKDIERLLGLSESEL